MNNVYIIVLPALALGGFAYGVWQRQMARHDAERAFAKKHTLLQVAYSELQVDHGVTVARADDLEQELERITNQAADVLKHELKNRDELKRENEKLHVQVKALVETLTECSAEILRLQEEKGKVDEDTLGTTTQTSPKPRRPHKRQATDTASH